MSQLNKKRKRSNSSSGKKKTPTFDEGSQLSTKYPLLRIKPAEISKKISVAIEKNVFQYNGKWYVIYKDCDNMTNDVIEELSPLKKLDDPLSNYLEPGVYVWVISSDTSGSIHLYAKKTIFVQEIQTKHHNIIYDLQNDKDPGIVLNELYYAGELQVDGDVKQINLNFLSGSYMLDRTPQTDELRKPVLNFFKDMFPKYEIIYDNSMKTYITGDTFKMDETLFNILKKVCPGTIYEFDTKDDAMRFSKFEMNNIKLETQIEIIKQNLKNPLFKSPENQSKMNEQIAEKQNQKQKLDDFSINKVQNQVEGGGKKRKKSKVHVKTKRKIIKRKRGKSRKSK